MIDVLLVEPDQVLSKTYQTAFNKAGLKAVGCHSAERAIAMIDVTNPKVIVLELQLGEHNGVEFLYEMRSYSDLEKIPIIIHSRIAKEISGIDSKVQSQLGIKTYCYKQQTKLSQLVDVVKQAMPVKT